MRNKPTYQEIAEATGMSLATISRVLHQSQNVKDETKEKVLSSIAAMGYDVSALVEAKPHDNFPIICNIPTFENPFYSLVIRGVKDAAQRNGYSLLVSENSLKDSTETERFLSMVRKTKAVGLVVTNSLSKETLMRLDEVVPVVQCCECIDPSPVPFVTIDDVGAARSAVNHLLTLGKRRIALLAGSMEYKYARGRMEGYRNALLQAGLPIDENLIIQIGEINYDMALSAAYQLLNSPNRPDAFFTTSDVYAAAVVKAAKRSLLRLPDDVAVVGFDNIEISSMCTPSITTVNQPKYQMGLLSCDMLSERISKRSIPLKNMYVETELIVRETTTRRSRIS